jgi:excisionase family DNA binding protein
MPTDELLRLDQAAELMRVGERTIRRYIRGRDLPAIRR